MSNYNNYYFNETEWDLIEHVQIGAVKDKKQFINKITGQTVFFKPDMTEQKYIIKLTFKYNLKQNLQ